MKIHIVQWSECMNSIKEHILQLEQELLKSEVRKSAEIK